MSKSLREVFVSAEPDRLQGALDAFARRNGGYKHGNEYSFESVSQGVDLELDVRPGPSGSRLSLYAHANEASIDDLGSALAISVKKGEVWAEAEAEALQVWERLLEWLRNDGYEVKPVGKAAPEPKNADMAATTAEPWEVIPDVGWNRYAVELWHAGYTSEEIGEKVGRTGKTVLNRLSLLRQTYGFDVVPERRDQKKTTYHPKK